MKESGEEEEDIEEGHAIIPGKDSSSPSSSFPGQSPSPPPESSYSPGRRGILDNSDQEIRFLQAAVLVEDAREQRPLNHDISESKKLKIYRLFWRKSIQWTLNFITLSILILPAFETPKVTLRLNDSSEKQSLLPPYPTSEIIELMFLLSIAIFDVWPRWWCAVKGAYSPQKRSSWWFILYNVVVFLSIADCVVYIVLGGVYGRTETDIGINYIRFSRPLRVYMIVFRVESLRTTMTNIIQAFISVAHLFGLFFLIVLVFAGVGVLIFDGTPESATFFPNTLEAAYNLLMLTTTCNNPDVYIPAYNHNWFSFLFFMFYSAITQLFFLNLILTAIVSSWRGKLKQDVSEKIVMRREALKAAFLVLTKGEQMLQRDQFIGMLRIHKSEWPEKKFPIYWAIIDRNNRGVIDESDFLLIADCLQISFTHVTKMWKWVPEKLSQVLKAVVTSKSFKVLIEIMIVMVSLWPIAEVELRHVGIVFLTQTQATVIEFSFLGVFTLELVIKLLADRSLQTFLASAKNQFDLFLVLVSWLAAIIQLILSTEPTIIKISMTVRLVRFLCTIIGSWDKFSSLFGSVLDVLGLILIVLLCHIVWIYLFTTIGVELLGDVIRTRIEDGQDMGYGLMKDSDYYKLGYINLGYGSFLEGIVATWILLIVNNHHVIHQAYVIATGHKAVRLFFILFWILDVVCTMAVFVAVLLEIVIKQWENKLADKADERRIEIEAKVKAVAESVDDDFLQNPSAKPKVLIINADTGPTSSTTTSVPIRHSLDVAQRGDIAERWVSRRKNKVAEFMTGMVAAEITESDLKASEARVHEKTIQSLKGVYQAYSRPSLNLTRAPVERDSIDIQFPMPVLGSASSSSSSLPHNETKQQDEKQKEPSSNQ